MHKAHVAVDHQAGADKQDKRNRNVRTHKGSLHTAETRPVARRSSCGERLAQVGPGSR